MYGLKEAILSPISLDRADTVDKLIKENNGIDLGFSRDDYSILIEPAAKYGSVNVVNMMLEKGVTKYYNNAIMSASQRCYIG